MNTRPEVNLITIAETDQLANLEVIGSNEREMTVFRLVEAGLAEIDRRYGPDGIRPQAYHNADHTRDVMDAAIQLADEAIAKGEIEPGDKDLLILAACYHDIERDYESGANEAASARIIALQMRESNQFSEQDIVKVYKMIMGTEVWFANGRMFQSADPNDKLSMLLADADLASLGRSPQTYWDRAMRYIKEVTDNTEPTADQILHFALEQDNFLNQHEFYTEEANRLFPYKQANLRFTQQMQRFYASYKA